MKEDGTQCSDLSASARTGAGLEREGRELDVPDRRGPLQMGMTIERLIPICYPSSHNIRLVFLEGFALRSFREDIPEFMARGPI